MIVLLISLAQRQSVTGVVWFSFVSGVLLFLILYAAAKVTLTDPGFNITLVGNVVVSLPIGAYVVVYTLLDGGSLAAAATLAELYQGSFFLLTLVFSRMIWPVLIPRIREARRRQK
jgi:hypothetical protein